MQLSHAHNSSFPLGLNKGKGANTGVQLTLPHHYSKEVLRSHTNFDVLRMCSLMFMQSTQICIITGFVVGFIGLYLSFFPHLLLK